VPIFPKRPAPQQRPPAPATRAAATSTNGPVHAVPCPHCRQPMDFRPHVGGKGGGGGWGDQGVEPGAKVDCDACGKTSKILGRREVTIITLAPE
jgi:hypothetical protein